MTVYYNRSGKLNSADETPFLFIYFFIETTCEKSISDSERSAMITGKILIGNQRELVCFECVTEAGGSC